MKKSSIYSLRIGRKLTDVYVVIINQCLNVNNTNVALMPFLVMLIMLIIMPLLSELLTAFMQLILSANPIALYLSTPNLHL